MHLLLWPTACRAAASLVPSPKAAHLLHSACPAMFDSLSGETSCCACVQNARKHLDLASAASSDSSLSDWDWLKIDKDNEYRLKVCLQASLNVLPMHGCMLCDAWR